LKITQREVGDVVILDLEGKLLGGPDQWDQLKDLFKTLVQGGKKKIIVNLEKINRISSTGFGILIGRRKEIREIGGDLVLMQFQDPVKNPFYIMELNRLFKAFESEEDALNSFKE
jgi:anti-anti-sigma factor